MRVKAIIFTLATLLWGVTADATMFKDTVKASGDNVYVNVTDAALYAGAQAGNSAGDVKHMGCRFTNVTIPQGATVDSARMILIQFTSGNGNLLLTFKGVIDSNPAQATTYAGFNGFTLGSQSVAWDRSPAPSFVEGVIDTSPNIGAVVNEIVNQANWSSGNAMIIELRDNSSAVQGFWEPYDFGANFAPAIVIYYTTGGSAPSAPTLSSPADGATDQVIQPTLSWNASSGATSYRVQVSTISGNYTSPIYDQSGVTGTSQQTAALQNSATCYWHVNATNSNGTSSYSTERSFTTGAAPSAPTLSSPGDGATGVSTTPTLSWNAVSGAIIYRVQISGTSGNYGSPVYDNASVSSTSDVASGLSGSTTYFWHVRVTTAYGTSAYSTERSFTTTTVASGGRVLIRP